MSTSNTEAVSPCCVDCGHTVDIVSDRWVCPSCGHEWQIDADGVVRLGPTGHALSSTGTEMKRITDELRSLSPGELSEHVTRLEETYDSFTYQRFLDPARADWTMLGNFYGKSVLDIGSGLGAVSITLAARGADVMAIDTDLDRLGFLAQVRRLEGLARLTPVHGDITNLPVGRGAVDRITMIGVLEHARALYGDGTPRECQVRLLRYLREHLEAGGELWVAIENRLAPRHFGGRTYHDELPFTPLIPDSAASRVARLAGRQGHEVRLASERGLRKMLAEAGYADVDFFYAMTDYRSPRFIASTAEDAVIRTHMDSVRQGATLKAKVGMGLISAADRLGLAGTFCPAFYFKAGRG